MNNTQQAGETAKFLHVRPSLYAMYFEGLKQIAHDHGYNLCIHGSMNRDFDLVAFPWADEVKPHFDMVDAMREYLGGRFNAGNSEGDLGAQRKHGRVGYLINIYRNTPFTHEKDQQYYLDIAVFPHTPTPDAVEAVEAKSGDFEQLLKRYTTDFALMIQPGENIRQLYEHYERGNKLLVEKLKLLAGHAEGQKTAPSHDQEKVERVYPDLEDKFQVF